MHPEARLAVAKQLQLLTRSKDAMDEMLRETEAKMRQVSARAHLHARHFAPREHDLTLSHFLLMSLFFSVRQCAAGHGVKSNDERNGHESTQGTVRGTFGACMK